MKYNPHTLINVQAVSEPQRAKHRRKVYSCYKAGMTKYAAAKKCRIQETTVGRWYRRFDAAGEEAVHGGKRGQGVACGQEAPSDGKSPESGRRGAPVGEEGRAGIFQAAISQEGSASCR